MRTDVERGGTPTKKKMEDALAPITQLAKMLGMSQVSPQTGYRENALTKTFPVEKGFSPDLAHKLSKEPPKFKGVDNPWERKGALVGGLYEQGKNKLTATKDSLPHELQHFVWDEVQGQNNKDIQQAINAAVGNPNYPDAQAWFQGWQQQVANNPRVNKPMEATAYFFNNFLYPRLMADTGNPTANLDKVSRMLPPELASIYAPMLGMGPARPADMPTYGYRKKYGR